MPAAFRTIADSMSEAPHVVFVPTLPGPSPATMTWALAAWRAARRPVNTLTASRSPPKAWPAVTTASSRPSRRSRAATRESGAGSAALSVMT